MTTSLEFYRTRDNKYRECCEKQPEKGNKYGTDELKMYMKKQKELRRLRAVQEFEERERVLESKKLRLKELDSKCKQIAYSKRLEQIKKASLAVHPSAHRTSHSSSANRSPEIRTSRSKPSAKQSRYDDSRNNNYNDRFVEPTKIKLNSNNCDHHHQLHSDPARLRPNNSDHRFSEPIKLKSVPCDHSDSMMMTKLKSNNNYFDNNYSSDPSKLKSSNLDHRRSEPTKSNRPSPYEDLTALQPSKSKSNTKLEREAASYIFKEFENIVKRECKNLLRHHRGYPSCSTSATSVVSSVTTTAAKSATRVVPHCGSVTKVDKNVGTSFTVYESDSLPSQVIDSESQHSGLSASVIRPTGFSSSTTTNFRAQGQGSSSYLIHHPAVGAASSTNGMDHGSSTNLRTNHGSSTHLRMNHQASSTTSVINHVASSSNASLIKPLTSSKGFHVLVNNREIKRKKYPEVSEQVKIAAATRIQAAYKSYKVRSILSDAKLLPRRSNIISGQCRFSSNGSISSSQIRSSQQVKLVDQNSRPVTTAVGVGLSTSSYSNSTNNFPSDSLIHISKPKKKPTFYKPSPGQSRGNAEKPYDNYYFSKPDRNYFSGKTSDQNYSSYYKSDSDSYFNSKPNNYGELYALSNNKPNSSSYYCTNNPNKLNSNSFYIPTTNNNLLGKAVSPIRPNAEDSIPGYIPPPPPSYKPSSRAPELSPRTLPFLRLPVDEPFPNKKVLENFSSEPSGHSLSNTSSPLKLISSISKFQLPSALIQSDRHDVASNLIKAALKQSVSRVSGGITNQETLRMLEEQLRGSRTTVDPGVRSSKTQQDSGRGSKIHQIDSSDQIRSNKLRLERQKNLEESDRFSKVVQDHIENLKFLEEKMLRKSNDQFRRFLVGEDAAHMNKTSHQQQQQQEQKPSPKKVNLNSNVRFPPTSSMLLNDYQKLDLPDPAFSTVLQEKLKLMKEESAGGKTRRSKMTDVPEKTKGMQDLPEKTLEDLLVTTKSPSKRSLTAVSKATEQIKMKIMEAKQILEDYKTELLKTNNSVLNMSHGDDHESIMSYESDFDPETQQSHRSLEAASLFGPDSEISLAANLGPTSVDHPKIDLPRPPTKKSKEEESLVESYREPPSMISVRSTRSEFPGKKKDQQSTNKATLIIQQDSEKRVSSNEVIPSKNKIQKSKNLLKAPPTTAVDEDQSDDTEYEEVMPPSVSQASSNLATEDIVYETDFDTDLQSSLSKRARHSKESLKDFSLIVDLEDNQATQDSLSMTDEPAAPPAAPAVAAATIDSDKTNKLNIIPITFPKEASSPLVSPKEVNKVRAELLATTSLSQQQQKDKSVDSDDSSEIKSFERSSENLKSMEVSDLEKSDDFKLLQMSQSSSQFSFEDRQAQISSERVSKILSKSEEFKVEHKQIPGSKENLSELQEKLPKSSLKDDVLIKSLDSSVSENLPSSVMGLLTEDLQSDESALVQSIADKINALHIFEDEGKEEKLDTKLEKLNASKTFLDHKVMSAFEEEVSEIQEEINEDSENPEEINIEVSEINLEISEIQEELSEIQEEIHEISEIREETSAEIKFKTIIQQRSKTEATSGIRDNSNLETSEIISSEIPEESKETSEIPEELTKESSEIPEESQKSSEILESRETSEIREETKLERPKISKQQQQKLEDSSEKLSNTAEIGYSQDFETDVESSAASKQLNAPAENSTVEVEFSNFMNRREGTSISGHEEKALPKKAEDSIITSFLSEQESIQTDADDISGKIVEEFTSVSESSNVEEGLLETTGEESVKPASAEILKETETEMPEAIESPETFEKLADPASHHHSITNNKPAELQLSLEIPINSDASQLSEALPTASTTFLSSSSKSQRTDDFDNHFQVVQSIKIAASHFVQTEKSEKTQETVTEIPQNQEISTQFDSIQIAEIPSKQENQPIVQEPEDVEEAGISEISEHLPSSSFLEDEEVTESEKITGKFEFANTDAPVVEQFEFSGSAKIMDNKVKISEVFEDTAQGMILQIPENQVQIDENQFKTYENHSKTGENQLEIDETRKTQENQAETPENQNETTKNNEKQEHSDDPELLESLTKSIAPDIIDKIESLIASEISKHVEAEDEVSSESSQATAVEDSRYSSYVSNFHVEDVVYESDFDTDVPSEKSSAKNDRSSSSLLENAVKEEVQILARSSADLKTVDDDNARNEFLLHQSFDDKSTKKTVDENKKAISHSRIKHILDDKSAMDALVSRIISRMLKDVTRARTEAFKEVPLNKSTSVVEVAESEGSSVQGEVDADAEWFEDDLLSGSVADDESLKREAAEIVAEQLRIENEIRALEALQAQVPATLLNLSDIPDKPPPPYSPPSSDSLSFSVRSFTVQTSLPQLQEMIDAQITKIWLIYKQTGQIPSLEDDQTPESEQLQQAEKSFNNRGIEQQENAITGEEADKNKEEKLESQQVEEPRLEAAHRNEPSCGDTAAAELPVTPTRSNNIVPFNNMSDKELSPSKTSTRAFDTLLQNLIHDTIKEVLLIEDLEGPSMRDFIDRIRPGSLALEAQRMRIPKTKESLSSIVFAKVRNLLPFTVLANQAPIPRKRLTKWTSRPRDLVDEVLAEELIDEDREWTESWPEEILVLDRWAEKFARRALGEVTSAFRTAFTG